MTRKRIFWLEKRNNTTTEYGGTLYVILKVYIWGRNKSFAYTSLPYHNNIQVLVYRGDNSVGIFTHSVYSAKFVKYPLIYKQEILSTLFGIMWRVNRYCNCCHCWSQYKWSTKEPFCHKVYRSRINVYIMRYQSISNHCTFVACIPETITILGYILQTV